MKITQEQKLEIKRLSKEGMTLREIAKTMGINFSTVHYHLNPEKKKEAHKKYWSGLSKQRKKEIAKKYQAYKRDYFRKKYQEDEEFREKKKQKSREYYGRKRDEKLNGN